MADLVQEISRDYDYDFEPDPGNDYLIDVDDTIENEIDQLLGAYTSVEAYGMNPAAHVLLNTAGFLRGSALESMASGSVLFTNGMSADSQMALESISDKIKEKFAIWGAKLLTFFHTMSSKVSGVLTTMWEKISTTAKTLIHGTWEKAKTAGRVIKAHPYKTILAVVGAAGAVVGILALVGSAHNVTANASAWQSFIARVKDGFTKIKMPGKEIIPDVTDGGKLIVDVQNTSSADPITGTADKLGWTKVTVNGILGALSRVWSGLKNSVTSVGNFVKSTASKINQNGRDLGKNAGDLVQKKTGSGIAGWATQQIINKTILGWLWMLTGAVYKVFSRVFTKAWAMISDTFSSLKSDVKTAEA